MGHMQCKFYKSEQLVDFLEGRLGHRQRKRVEDHLSECNYCLDSLLTVHRIAHYPDKDATYSVPYPVTQRTVSHIGKLVGGEQVNPLLLLFRDCYLKWTRLVSSLGDTFGFALARVRGKEHRLSNVSVLLEQSFDDFDTEIEIEKIGSGFANIKVFIADTTLDDSLMRVTLVQNEREIISCLVSRDTVFFDAIPYGSYKLVYMRNGVKVGKYDFVIKETGDGR
jgi:hypothetical protein